MLNIMMFAFAVFVHVNIFLIKKEIETCLHY